MLESTAISRGLAFSTFFSQNYGAGNKARVRSGVKTGLKLSAAAVAVVTGAILLAGKYMLQAFIDAGESEGTAALEIAWHYLLIMAICLIVCYLIHVYRNAMQAVGKSGFLKPIDK